MKTQHNCLAISACVVILAPANPPPAENGDVSSVKSMGTSHSPAPTPVLEEGNDLNQAGLHLIRLVVCAWIILQVVEGDLFHDGLFLLQIWQAHQHSSQALLETRVSYLLVF